MFRKKAEKKQSSGAVRILSVCCPRCRSKKVDGHTYGEGGRFECRDCRTIFTIEATPKKS